MSAPPTGQKVKLVINVHQPMNPTELWEEGRVETEALGGKNQKKKCNSASALP